MDEAVPVPQYSDTMEEATRAFLELLLHIGFAPEDEEQDAE